MRLPALLIAAFFGLAAALAWHLSRRDPQHRPIALALAFCAAADVTREVLGAFVLRPARVLLGDAVPYAGAARVAFHLEQALLLGGYAALAGCGLAVFAGTKKERPAGEASRGGGAERIGNAGTMVTPQRAVKAAWLAAVAGCALAYPDLSGWPSARWSLWYAYACAAGLAAVTVLFAATGYRGAWQARHVVGVALVGGLLGEIANYALGPAQGWNPARVGWSLVLGVVVLYQGRRAWKS